MSEKPERPTAPTASAPRARLNRLITVLATVVLCVTIALLFWLYRRTAGEIRATVERTLDEFDPSVLGDPGDLVVSFGAAEDIARAAQGNPYIRRMVLTKWIATEGRESPVVPYDLMAVLGPEWTASLAGLERHEIRTGGRSASIPARVTAGGTEDGSAEGALNGHLYLEIDRSAMNGVLAAIGAVALSLVSTLALLLGRLHSQQTIIQRTGIELNQQKQELIRLERLALAGQLSAGLLHDLKKPVLNVRHILEDLTYDQPAMDDETRQTLDRSREQTDLFFQILGNTRIEKFVKSDRMGAEFVDVNEIVRMSRDLVHYEQRTVEITEEFADDLPLPLAKPYELVQVFSNLILNAYQALGGTGRVTLRTEARDGGIRVSVIDDGPGIPEAVRAAIFEPFFTTKGESEGSGLGLAISRLIIEGMRGTIGVESREGGPTAFHVWIPASDDEGTD